MVDPSAIDVSAGSPNEPPIGVDDEFEVVENTSLNVAVPGLLANDSDPEGDPFEITGASQPGNGNVAISPQGSFAYTPDLGFTGLDSFLYELTDDQGNSTGLVVEVLITVIADPRDPGPNSPPIGVDDAFEVVEGTTLSIPVPGVLANDSDPDGDAISVPSASSPANGSLSMQQVGSFQYTPDPGFTGVDSFRYAVEDDQGNTTGVAIDVVITVTGSPEPTTTIAATTTSTTATTTATEPAAPTTAGETAEPTEPTDPADLLPDPPAEVGAAGGESTTPPTTTTTTTTTTLPGALPATGAAPIALGVGVLLLAAGTVLTVLGTIATSRRNM
jgi:hypothetical protein